MSYGITTTGFNLKTLADIRDETTLALQASLGATINLSGNSPLGQIKGVLDERVSLIWELGQFVYNSQYPNTAIGTSLDNIASINNIVRLQAEKTKVTATITGTPSTVVSAGFQAHVQGNDQSVFETIADVTIGGGGTVDVEMQCTVTGPVQVLANTLNQIVTPTAGVSSIDNALDGDLGRDVETDADFRIRRLQLLQRSGTATLEGIRNNVLTTVDDVERVLVIENDTYVTDPFGRPAKSFETYVLGGIDAQIANAIFLSKPAGITAHGSVTVNVTDSQGNSHTIGFSRPTQIDIYLIVNIVPNTNPSEGDIYPVDGDAQVKNVILAYASTLNIGNDVIINRLYTPINTISGVIGIEILAGIAPSPTQSNNISIDAFELAVFDSSRITVNS